MKALFFNGFHIYIYMWQKGGKRGQKPLILLEAATEEAVFCFPAFYAAVTATTWAVFRCITLQQRCMVLSKLMGDHKKAPPLQGRADFCTHLYAVWVHWFMRVFAHFSRDALKCTHP